MGLIQNEFVFLKKIANFRLVVGTRFSKLERIGINLNNIEITIVMGLIRNEFVCLKKMANFHIALEHDFQSWKESE